MCPPPPLGWQRAQSSSHPSERKCRVHSSMSPNTEKRCRSSDRVILLGILPMNTTRRSSCGQGAPCREPGPGGGTPASQARGLGVSEPLRRLPPTPPRTGWSLPAALPACPPPHSLLHVPSGGSSAFGSGPVRRNCTWRGRKRTRELQGAGRERSQDQDAGEMPEVLPSPQGGRAHRLLLLLLLRGEGDRDRDCLRDGDLDE